MIISFDAIVIPPQVIFGDEYPGKSNCKTPFLKTWNVLKNPVPPNVNCNTSGLVPVAVP